LSVPSTLWSPYVCVFGSVECTIKGVCEMMLPFSPYFWRLRKNRVLIWRIFFPVGRNDSNDSSFWKILCGTDSANRCTCSFFSKKRNHLSHSFPLGNKKTENKRNWETHFATSFNSQSFQHYSTVFGVVQEVQLSSLSLGSVFIMK